MNITLKNKEGKEAHIQTIITVTSPDQDAMDTYFEFIYYKNNEYNCAECPCNLEHGHLDYSKFDWSCRKHKGKKPQKLPCGEKICDVTLEHQYDHLRKQQEY